MNRSVLELTMVLLALAAPVANSTTLARIELARLYADADIVAEVQIASGESLGLGKDSCGAKYKARVEVPFKGATKGELIEFGYFHGYEIGYRYVLFLAGPDRERQYLASTNSLDVADRLEYRKRCAKYFTVNSVVHSGNGALLVNWASQLEFKDGVRVPARYVVLPEGTKTVPATPGEDEAHSEPVWILLDEFEGILHTFGE